MTNSTLDDLTAAHLIAFKQAWRDYGIKLFLNALFSGLVWYLLIHYLGFYSILAFSFFVIVAWIGVNAIDRFKSPIIFGIFEDGPSFLMSPVKALLFILSRKPQVLKKGQLRKITETFTGELPTLIVEFQDGRSFRLIENAFDYKYSVDPVGISYVVMGTNSSDLPLHAALTRMDLDKFFSF